MMKRVLLLLLMMTVFLSGCEKEAAGYYLPTYVDEEVEGVTMTILEVTPTSVIYVIRVEKENLSVTTAISDDQMVEKWNNNQWEMLPRRAYPTTGGIAFSITREEPQYFSCTINETEEPLQPGRYRMVVRIRTPYGPHSYSVKAEFDWGE
ncbi:MAG: hypothetical protein IJR95_00895 [Lachnospiraceae bacterium]|nr:hypothetical protein [Lachnospiraceae bacterium]